MTPTDTTERTLEDIVVRAMTGRAELVSPPHTVTGDDLPVAGGTGWLLGDREHFDRAHCVDVVQLCGFVEATQPELVGPLGLAVEGPLRLAFLNRLQGEIKKRGIVDVLRKGVDHGVHHVELFYGAPTPGNAAAERRYALNRFSVTRQLRYSEATTKHALDLGLFVNGLPVFTAELKNSLTKQTVADAVEQYRRDRDRRERLFEFGRCLAHFAIDDREVRFCTWLVGKTSWFLPFNKGVDDGAGNPVNPRGLATAYLWEEILTPDGLTDILENYALRVDRRDPKTKRRERKQIFPRFHQLRAVRRLLADVRARGAGRRYLVQHSAGSGKSNTIAWLVHQLVGLAAGNDAPVFDSVVVVTDRVVLDKQLRDTIKQFVQVRSTLGHAARSGDLRRFLAAGKKIIVTTVQKFPFVLDEIGSTHRGRRFAIVIDEAHSSQGGKTAAALNLALAEGDARDDALTTEDRINRIIEARRMLPNASYFAFTATPKNKTLEMFGERVERGAGEVGFEPFDHYTMKQAIQEGFIRDVLRHYTPVKSYYKLVKTVADDPEFDVKRAQKKLRRFVEGNEHAIRLKAEIMVDHFLSEVIARRKVGGQARAMVVCNGVARAIEYHGAIEDYLRRRRSPYRAVVAFSGEREVDGVKVSEAALNGFPSAEIEARVATDPYRFLICADKFQTGYDEPLLQTMYVDKTLSGIRAVQTLSRLNRARLDKGDVFVLDFVNEPEQIKAAFDDYYRTTLLVGESDPNKLNDLMTELAAHEVYRSDEVEALVEAYLGGAERDRLDPILDGCVAVYTGELDEDSQVDFKGKAKAFVRAYGFLATVLPASKPSWEKLSIFLDFLIPKLPAPVETDLAQGILEVVDMESYRAERQATRAISLTDEDAEIEPVPVGGGGQAAEAELDRLSRIVASFNELFGNIEWEDGDRVQRLLTVEMPEKVVADPDYEIARQSPDAQNARIALDRATQRVFVSLIKDDTQLFKKLSDDADFRRAVVDMLFRLTYLGRAEPEGEG